VAALALALAIDHSEKAIEKNFYFVGGCCSALCYKENISLTVEKELDVHKRRCRSPADTIARTELLFPRAIIDLL
jgi:hypothetical protein